MKNILFKSLFLFAVILFSTVILNGQCNVSGVVYPSDGGEDIYYCRDSPYNLPYSFYPQDEFVIMSGAVVTAVSPQSIVLKEGFHAQTGSVFKTKLDVIIGMKKDILVENIENQDVEIYVELENNEKDIQGEMVLNIYPSPTSDIVNIEISEINENTKLEIFNSLGKIIFSDKILNEYYQVDISSQPSGIYFVKIINEGNVHTKRIVRQ